MSGSEILFWRYAAQDLGIEIIAPFQIMLPDGFQLEVSALVANFGSSRGILVDKDYASLRPHTQAIVKLGYGYSTELGGSVEQYQRAEIIKTLSEWGWTGAPDKKPSWLSESSN